MELIPWHTPHSPTCAHTYTRKDARAHTHTHTHARTRAHAHTHTRAHAQARVHRGTHSPTTTRIQDSTLEHSEDCSDPIHQQSLNKRPISVSQVGLLRSFTVFIDRHKRPGLVGDQKATLREAQVEMAGAGATEMVAIAVQDPDKEVFVGGCGSAGSGRAKVPKCTCP